jgi:membrane protease YdiL (CAAX protease family)
LLEELVFRGVILAELLNLAVAEQGRVGAATPNAAASAGNVVSAPEERSATPLNATPGVPEPERLRLSFWMANLSTSLAFVGLHWPWWIFTEGLSFVVLARSAGVFALSSVLGMLLVRSRSIWPCVFVHWLNNALVSLLNVG